MSTLDERIKELVDATGWSVGKIASVADVSSSAVSQWLGNTGKSGKVTKSISLRPALLLERATGFSALWLSEGDGPKMAPSQARELDLPSALRHIGEQLAALPKIKRDGARTYITHLIDHCDQPSEVEDAIALIESALRTKQAAA